ncbi:MAG: hypothetical protein HKL81_01425 [Acidimicrobiaceae bacterium]|nr:hypothetical protein [Acidimicrobiaceae bacterium]
MPYIEAEQNLSWDDWKCGYEACKLASSPESFPMAVTLSSNFHFHAERFSMRPYGVGAVRSM